jgi:hypothetical protein
MPPAAKEALTQNGNSRPRPANGKAKDSSKAAEAWSEEQELALVQVWPLLYAGVCLLTWYRTFLNVPISAPPILDSVTFVWSRSSANKLFVWSDT